MNMYIIINSDLKLTKGQISSQTAHIVHKIIEELVQSAYEEYPVPESYLTYKKWCECPTTIIKKAPESDLKELSKMDFARSFSDDVYNKQTKQKIYELTIVGFYPGCISDDYMKKFDLL